MHRLLAVLCAAAALAPAAEPTAHSPRFDDRAVWPHLEGQEAFVAQPWPAARVLVWAHPGVDGHRRKGRDPHDPASWLENGRPASAPPDDDTDVVFPAADRQYRVELAGRGIGARHITVGRNAFAIAWRLHGNLWVKPGGEFKPVGNWNSGGFKIVGDKHTFLRNDNEAPLLGEARGSGVDIAQWITVEKTGGGSVEFLGRVGAADEFKVNEGIAVIGPHSALTVGPASLQLIGPEGALCMMSDSYFGKHTNLARNDADVLVQGWLLAGLPDRPLKGDATVGISFKFESKLEFVGSVDKRTAPKGFSSRFNGPSQFSYGLVVDEQGGVRVHSADPSQHQLVLRWHGAERSLGQGADNEPRTINMLFLGDVVLDGVLFDHVKAGGIELRDESMRRSWGHVAFGDHNAAPPDQLFAVFDGQGRQGQQPTKVGGE